jgi:hypothetical protein
VKAGGCVAVKSAIAWPVLAFRVGLSLVAVALAARISQGSRTFTPAHDQALREAAAALAAAQDILALDGDLPAHLVDQARHLLGLAQQGIDRALSAD